jgi:hypothetical protein
MQYTGFMSRAGFVSAAVGLSLFVSSFLGGAAFADVMPKDYADPNIDLPYTGGSNPVAWGPKYTTDSYAWTEADRAILRQADTERRRMQQDSLDRTRGMRTRSQQLNGFRRLTGISRSTGAPPTRIFARSVKPIRIEPLHFTGKRAGAGLVGHLPQSRTAGSTPTFARIFSGGGSFSFGAALQRGDAGVGSVGFGEALQRGGDGKPVRFDFSR